MKRFFLSILLIYPVGLSAQDIVKFENGQVADAGDINSNFSVLQEMINDLPADTSCSIDSSSDTATITCPVGGSVTVEKSNSAATCEASDFVGRWMFSEPSSDNTNNALFYFYNVESGGQLSRQEYTCDYNRCTQTAVLNGSWTGFSAEYCAITIYANVTGTNSARGVVYLSPSKSTVTGFICDQVAGCSAGTLSKSFLTGSGSNASSIEPLIAGEESQGR